MLKFFILLSAVACALGATIPEGMLPQLDGRIVGGSPTTIGSYPWQVAVLRGNSYSCGGTIYSPNIIITAARCLQFVYPSDLKVRAGSTNWASGGTLVSVAAFKNHEGYDGNTLVNDIAVIRLSSSLTTSSTIKPIGLASSAPANGAAAVVSGWGSVSSESFSTPSQLRYVDVNMVSRAQCASSSYGYGSEIKSTMICARADGKDICQGDSGSPLVSDGVLVGVASGIYSCAAANYPGVYTDVAAFRSWIVRTASSV